MEKLELKRFRIFSLSPYHNTNKTITRLIEYVEKYFHVLNGKSPIKRFEKSRIYEVVYGGASFNEGTFAVLRSQTLNLLENFFILEGFRGEKKLQQKFLSESYSKRNLSTAFKNNFLKFEEMNLAEKQTDPHWTMHRLEILMTKMSWHDYDKKKQGYDAVLEILEDLDIFYLHQKMRNEALKANIGRGKRIPADKLFYEKTISDQLSTYKTKSKEIDLYLRLHQLLTEKNTNLTTVEEFRKDFDNASQDLHALDKDLIYIDLQNLLIRQHYQKGRQVASVLFDTFLTGIKSNIIDVKEEIKYTTFFNILSAGCSARKFEQVESFVNEYGPKINESDRESTLLLTEAYILFNKRKKENWAKVADLNNDFNHSNLLFRCMSRSLKVRAFFMMYLDDESYYTVALSQIKAFKAFISREKTGLKRVGEQNQRLSYWLQKLLAAFYEKRRKKDILKIFTKIEEDEKLNISIKEWILELRIEMKNR